METTEKLLSDWILPKTLDSGCFGKQATLEDFSVDDEKVEGQFASEIIFAQLKIKQKDEVALKTHHVVIKIQLRNEALRQLVDLSLQFQNEILMYEKILPLLNKNDIVQELFPV